MHSHTTRFSRVASSRRGFTLVELLTVIAIIAVLAAILIPTVSRVRENARKAKTRVQFSQWVTAIETFRQDQGFWPDFGSEPQAGNPWRSSDLDPEGNLVFNLGDTSRQRRIPRSFVEFLVGQQMDGRPFDQTFLNSPRNRFHPNRRGVTYLSMGDDSFVPDPDAPNELLIADAFGNTDIIVVMDGNLSGQVVLRTVPEFRVRSQRFPTTAATAPVTEDTRIRAQVVIYSAGPGGPTPDRMRDNFVKSWD